MQSSSFLKTLAASFFALALLFQAVSADHSATAAPAGAGSIVGNLSDFYANGAGGVIDIEKGGQTMHFNFGSNLMINGRPWTSWGMRSEDWGASIPNVLKLHCTLVRVYFNGGTASALKTISSGGSRFFC